MAELSGWEVLGAVLAGVTTTLGVGLVVYLLTGGWWSGRV